MTVAFQTKAPFRIESPVIGVCGWKNSGKTTLVTRLIAEFVARGLKVASVKHAHHSFEIDHPGRDSMRHRDAGASEVAVVSAARFAIIGELHGAPEPTLAEILARFSPHDLAIVEGYKSEPILKIEVRRREARGHDSLAKTDPTVIAIASDQPVSGERVPSFDLGDIRGLADFIAEQLGLATMATLKTRA